MSYFDSLTPAKRQSIAKSIDCMKRRGITNHYLIAAILAVMSKESNFELRSEKGYGGTANARIRKIFGARVAKLTEVELDALKVDDVAFFNRVYGGIIGNDKIGDGYKFRGRGLNQLTGRANYEAYAKISGHAIVENPDLLSDLNVAIDVVVAYMIDHLKHAPQLQRTTYNFTSINDFKTATDAANAAYNANAGWGKSPAACAADTTGGYRMTHERVGGFLAIVSATA